MKRRGEETYTQMARKKGIGKAKETLMEEEEKLARMALKNENRRIGNCTRNRGESNKVWRKEGKEIR